MDSAADKQDDFHGKLTMADEAGYKIQVVGYLGKPGTDWNQEIRIVEVNKYGSDTVTTLVCTVDQAGLLGTLRRLVNLGLPLMSVLRFS